jgi:hypothetical protein
VGSCGGSATFVGIWGFAGGTGGRRILGYAVASTFIGSEAAA